MTAPAPPLRILLLDTETNGLPKNRYAPVSEAGAWPAILQISWAEFTIDGKDMKAGNVRDIGVALHASIPWNSDAAKIHGLHEVEARHGTPPADALRELGIALRGVDVVVAHNLSFDKPVIRAAAYAEWLRGNGDDLSNIWPPGIREFCTMRETQNLVRITSPYYGADSGKFKAPRLNELHTWLYGHAYDISGAVLHTSRSDTHCLAQCLSRLLHTGNIIVTNGSLKSVIDASVSGAS
jgi:DNA polymerase-3 subunit alpha